MSKVIFKNANIVDGTGTSMYKSDVLVEGDTIKKIGKLGNDADKVYDCANLILTPGFIDIHNHSDFSVLGPHAENYIAQGVTTLISGPCGKGAMPIGHLNSENIFEVLDEEIVERLEKVTNFKEFTDLLDECGTAINTGFYIGHGSVRSSVMGLEDRKPTEEELEKMKKLVREGMESGAFGMSTGLAYIPGKYADEDEIVELLKVVGEYNGIYSTHMRNQADYIVDSIIDTVSAARKSGTRPLLSHIKATMDNVGLSETEIKLIEFFKGIGVEVHWDIYPYVRSGSNYVKKIQNRLKKDISYYIENNESNEIINVLKEIGRERNWKHVIIRDFDPKREFEGLSIFEISRMLNTDIFHTVIELIRLKPDVVITTERSYEDMINFFKHPNCIVGSDGYIASKNTHPRSYGSFTKVLTEFVIERRYFSLEEAVKKMTWNAAWKLRLCDRGIIKENMKADISVFNLKKLSLECSFKNPHAYSKGMEYVMINGQMVIEDGEFTGKRPGRYLRNKY